MKKNIDNPYMERFVAGFCHASTPFSTRIPKEEIVNPLKLKADEVFDCEEMNIWNDDFTESLCYFGGGILGSVMIPVDVVFAGITTVKRTFLVDKNAISLNQESIIYKTV